MSEFRLSPGAEAELDGIWTHIARESGSVDIGPLSVHGAAARRGFASRHGAALILHIVHGSRDLAALFGR
jgi:plasmid stabilization system protein ParE